MNRLTEKRNGKNVLPLRNAVCGLDIPYWRLDRHNEHETFLSGEAVDRLAAYEETGLVPDEVRGVGCPVCQCKEPLPKDGMSHEYYIRGNTLYHYDTHFGWEGSEINYCPECGARLEVSEDA